MRVRWVSANAANPPPGLYPEGWQVDQEIAARVAQIVATVRAGGDDALVEYTRGFDCPTFEGVDIPVRVPPFEEAKRLVPPAIADALESAKARVEDFHRRQLPEDIAYVESDGTRYAYCYRPLRAVAAYAPGGNAVLPSSVIMSVVPASIAGVERIAVFSPPQSDGSIAPAILFACALCGVDELYAVGGAQAVAAAAYGTKSIARVDKIVGPGNVWVTEAKRQVYGVCAIDGLAGPSEVLVVADGTADAHAVVGELLAQAEHDPRARAAVVSQSGSLLLACRELLDEVDTAKLERGEIVKAVLEGSTFLIHADTQEEIFSFVERFAPEHLSLHVGDPQEVLPHIRNAAAIFCGPQTPVACGDYIAGTNHVLPTSGSARFSSGLGIADFFRRFSVVENSEERLRHDAAAIAALASFEGLPAHARSALERLGR